MTKHSIHMKSQNKHLISFG